jgi:hypothetical protein
MTTETHPLHRTKIAVPIRVRGMSSENKFFDETTETSYLSASLVITRLPCPVELDSEIHVTSNVTRQGGNFRVVWVNVQGCEGWHDVGLELIDVEGNIWGKSLGKAEESAAAEEAHAFLQCQRCHVSQLTAVPEAESEFICDGFTIIRPCERCKATTPWGFTPVAAGTPEGIPREAGGPDQRRKGRIAMRMKIKVVRDRQGTAFEDICETINISGNGVYFLTQHRYARGESLKIIAPYKEGDVTIPVRARVVRLDDRQDTFLQAVAVELDLADMQGRSLLGGPAA